MMVALSAGLLLAAAFFVWSSPRSVGPSLVGAAASRAGTFDDAAAAPLPSNTPGLPAATLVELTATQLDAGLPLAEAVSILAHSTAGSGYPQLQRVAAALRLGLDWDTAWSSGNRLPRALLDYRDALEFTATSGAASASVLRGQAEQVRRAQFRRAERAAEALSVRLVLPLGLCCLPAFMCWGVLPVLMSLLPKVFGS